MEEAKEVELGSTKVFILLHFIMTWVFFNRNNQTPFVEVAKEVELGFKSFGETKSKPNYWGTFQI